MKGWKGYILVTYSALFCKNIMEKQNGILGKEIVCVDLRK